MEKRKFAVIGLGRFGAKLVEEFNRMGLEVIAIDIDSSRVENIRNLATESLVLDSIDKEALEKSGVKEVDVVIVGMGQNIEANILTTTLLKEIGVKEIIARAISPLHARILKKVGANRVVSPAEDMAVRLAHAIHFPGVQEYFDLKGPWDLAEIKIEPGSNFIGKTLKEIRDRTQNTVNILMVEEEIKGQGDSSDNGRIPRTTKIPHDDYIIREKDILILFGEPNNLSKFIEKGLK